MDEGLPVTSNLYLDGLWNEEAHLGGRLIRKAAKLNRDEIGNSIVEVFHAVGGVPRLAHWANEHYGLFVTKLLPKLLPQQVNQLVNNGQLNITYQAAIPPSALDEPPIDVEVSNS